MSDMSETEGRFAWIPTIARLALICALVFLALVAAGAVAMAVVRAAEVSETGRWVEVIPPTMLMLTAIITAVWSFVIYGVVLSVVSNRDSAQQSAAKLERIETLLEDQARSMRKLIEMESLSDKARSLVYRDREIQAMREVVHNDLMRQDYETAESLIQEMADKFGHVDEAAQLRTDLEAARKATLEEKIDASVARVQKIIESHDWPRAIRAAGSLIEVYPDNPKVASLPERVETERNKHKSELLAAYGEAVKKNDVDQSILLLRKLDRHLTPQEAAALQDSARGIFKAKLHNLGVQFAICVTDQRWNEAISTGEEIMRDYPNSRMSQEVRQKMPQLRANANAAAQATAP